MGVIEFDPASELLSKALFLSFLEFLEPFFQERFRQASLSDAGGTLSIMYKYSFL